ncbi:MAG TPA: ROK family protein [Trueperaceae bacterium]
MSHASPLVLALDFGGTKISAAAVVAGERDWLDLRRALSPEGADADSDYRIATELAEEVLAGSAPAAVGVSFGGPVEAGSGTVKLSHHVPGWEGVALARELEARFGAGVRVENDGIAGALGEYRYGAGQGVNSLLYLTVSTGVGGGIVAGGEIWRGADGMAGHVGHLRLEPDGPECVCGSRGCLESIAAGPAIAREARWRIEREPERARALLELAGGAANLTARHVAEAARGGDAMALELMERAGSALGIAIGSAANLLNPDAILVGGGVSKAGEPLWGPLLRRARETAMPEVSLDVRPAGLGDDAPLWGAAALAYRLLDPSTPAGRAVKG